MALITLGPLLAFLTLRQRALEGLQSLVNNLPNWLGGLPPDPPPSAQAAGSAGVEPATSSEPLPRPLTIHGGSPPTGPTDEQYSFSEQAGKPVWALEIPTGLAIPVKSGKPTEEGKEYEASVREELQFDPAPDDYKLGGKMPDGLTVSPQDNTTIALEVKYLSTNEWPLRDPGRNVKFIFKRDVAQARKYLDGYKGGVLWVTNDASLAAKYGEEFEKAGLSGIRIAVIPSIQE